MPIAKPMNSNLLFKNAQSTIGFWEMINACDSLRPNETAETKTQKYPTYFGVAHCASDSAMN